MSQSPPTSRTFAPRHATRAFAIATLLFAAGYAVGAWSVARGLWPTKLLHQLMRGTSQADHRFDVLGRLVSAPGKISVDCPAQTAETAVLLVIGQSNAANHGEHRFQTTQADRVVNFHAGTCTKAASPLLGATGVEGEFATPLADALVRDGSFRRVVILAGGVGETPVSRWQRDGDLNEHLLGTLRQAARTYRVTHIVWHQGESDALNHTTKALYLRAFASLRASLTDIGVNAPVFVAVATRCGPSPAWHADNPTARAQRSLIDDQLIFLGADTDALLAPADRRRDACHFSASGQRLVAEAYAQAIRRQQLNQQQQQARQRR